MARFAGTKSFRFAEALATAFCWLAFTLPASARADAGYGDEANELNYRNGLTILGGLPHGIELSYDRRLTEAFSIGLSAGGLGIPLDGRSGLTYRIGVEDAGLTIRWHPFSGAFFFGLIAGVQTLSGQATETFTIPGSPPTTLQGTAQVAITTGYFAPHLGWMWVFGPGFTLGLEAGAQLPFAPKTSLTTTIDDPTLQGYLTQLEALPQYQQLQGDVQSAGDKIGRLVFPYAAVRIGWSF